LTSRKYESFHSDIPGVEVMLCGAEVPFLTWKGLLVNPKRLEMAFTLKTKHFLL
jgi:hypothetical protein